MPTTRASSKKMAAAPAGNALQGMATTPTTVFHPNKGAPGMPQSQQNNMVQVPTDVLTNLLTSIDSLRQEVSLLRNDVGILRNDTPDFLKARQETSLLRTQVRFDMKAIITGNNDVKNQLRDDMNRFAKGHTDLIKGHMIIKNQMKYLNKSVRDLERHSGIAKGFTCFNQLPPELRIHIWRLALSQPELFAVEKTFKAIDGVDDAYYNDAYVAKWPTRKTQIKWVNQEARAEAKKILDCYQTNAFLNYDVDTVWLVQLDQMDEPYFDLVWERFQGRLKSLAIHYSFWDNHVERVKHISDYGDLIELILIVGKEEGMGKPVMVDPSNAPSHYTDEFPDLEGALWSAMSDKVVGQIKAVAEERNAYRKHLREGTYRTRLVTC
jgi:hypothetical protein